MKTFADLGRLTNPSGTPSQEKGRAPEGCGRKEVVMNKIAPIIADDIPSQRKVVRTFSGRPSIEYDGTIEIKPEEWASVFDNPRQRDTESRARRASHLMTPHPSHCKVNMALLPDGRRYKLDGHTRSYIWSAGTVAAPPVLYVDVWRCRSLEDAKELYSTFDSKAAVETAADQVFGAKKDAGAEFKSRLLKSGRFVSGMKFGHVFLHGVDKFNSLDTYALLKEWLAELRLLDKCEPTSRRFHTGITSAALLTLRRYGEDAVDFWTRFAAGTGIKTGGVTDPVQALEERMERRRGQNRLGGSTNVQEICGIAISAFERDRHGETYLAERLDEGDKKLRASGIKTTKGDSFREWMIAAKNARRIV